MEHIVDYQERSYYCFVRSTEIVKNMDQTMDQTIVLKDGRSLVETDQGWEDQKGQIITGSVLNDVFIERRTWY